MNGRTVALDTARQYVIKDRNSRHGVPEDNFETVARMWQAYADRRGWTTEFTRSDVAMLCILLKAARAANDPAYLDNYLDIIGYGACAYEVAELETNYVVPGGLNSLEGQAEGGGACLSVNIDALDLDTVAADEVSYPMLHVRSINDIPPDYSGAYLVDPGSGRHKSMGVATPQKGT